jgi:hypothetical protein
VSRACGERSRTFHAARVLEQLGATPLHITASSEVASWNGDEVAFHSDSRLVENCNTFDELPRSRPSHTRSMHPTILATFFETESYRDYRRASYVSQAVGACS